MKTNVPALSSALVVPLLFAVAVPADGPAFKPAKDSSLEKEFTTSMDFDLDDFSMVADGQDIGAVMGDFEFSMLMEQMIGVTDSYLEPGEGRPTKLGRSFDKLSNTMSMSFAVMGEGEDQEFEMESPLEGEKIVFTWNDGEGKYDIAFAEGSSGEEGLLDGLLEDMDLRAFLPVTEVEQDASWDVDIKSLKNVAMPGGVIKFEIQGMENEAEMQEFQEMFGEDFLDRLPDFFKGTCACTFKGVREEDGATLANIGVRIAINSATDFSEMILEVVDKIAEQQGEEAPEFSFDSCDISLEYEGEGTLVWDVARGTFRSFDVTGDMSMGFDISMDVEAEGESHSVEFSAEISGTYGQKASAE